MREYKKPETTVFSFLLKEPISDQSLAQWLSDQIGDTEIENAIQTYEVTSIT